MTNSQLGRESPMIGRAVELAAVASLVDGARNGSGDALLVRGEPGIGKTTLLVQAQRWAEAREMRVLVCRGVQAESNFPFAGLHQLLRPVLGLLPQLFNHQARLLRAALGSEETVPADFYRVALATLELLAMVAADRPLLIVADDAHWIDRPTTDVLAFVGRRIAAEPIAMVVAVREATEDPFAGQDLPNLVLSPLDERSSISLLHRVSPDLASDFRERVLRGAAGNPLALVELPAIVDQWTTSPTPMPVGELLERSFATQTEMLPKSTQALLLAAAAGAHCSLEDLGAAASEVHGQLVGPGDLQAAIAAKLVTIADEQVIFRHPMMAAAIYQKANIGERLAMHTALAHAVPEDDRRVWHRAAAALGSDDGLAAELEALASNAARRGAVSVSIAALDRAASLISDRTRRADTLLRASEQAVELGRRRLAMDLVARAEQDQLSPLGNARMLIVEDGVSPLHPHGNLTIPALIKAARAAHLGGDLDLAASVLWTAAKRCYWTGAPVADRVAIDEAADDLQQPVDDPRRIAIGCYLGIPEHRGHLEQTLRRSTAHPEDLANLSFLGSAAMNLEDHELAAPLLAGAAAAARRQGRLGMIPRLQSLRGWAVLWSSTLDSVTVAAGEAERLGGELDQGMWRGAATLEQALVTGLAGDYPAAKDQVTSALVQSGDDGVRLFRAMAVYGLGVVALGVGEYLAAYHHFRKIVEPADNASHYAGRQWVAGDLVEAALRAGRLEECAELLEDLGREWSTNPTSSVRRAGLYAAALLAPDSTAQACFDACFAAQPGSDTLDFGRLNLAYGSWLRRQRRAKEARPVLTDARMLFDRVGAGGFARRTDQELRAAGGIAVRRDDGLRPGLTPQELQIAQLAASGLSNRQIAEQLFLSHRTVSSHLYRIFPKLGIAARSDLTRALGTTPGPNSPSPTGRTESSSPTRP